MIIKMHFKETRKFHAKKTQYQHVLRFTGEAKASWKMLRSHQALKFNGKKTLRSSVSVTPNWAHLCVLSPRLVSVQLFPLVWTRPFYLQCRFCFKVAGFLLDGNFHGVFVSRVHAVFRKIRVFCVFSEMVGVFQTDWMCIISQIDSKFCLLIKSFVLKFSHLRGF